MEAELDSDLDKTMAAMVPHPHLFNVPTMVGVHGPVGVPWYFSKHLIGQFSPTDVNFETLSGTYSAACLVGEAIISFTHTTRIDWMLPGVEPTGKFVEVAFVVIVGIENDKAAQEHIHWDQTNVLVQIGQLDPTGLPLVGGVARLCDPCQPHPFFGEA